MKTASTLFARLALCLIAAGVALGVGTPSEVRLTPPSQLIPAGLFGMHIHHLATTTPWPVVRFANWRLWDAHVNWPDLEPVRGKWDFKTLDLYLDMAGQHHVDLLLPLALSPPWASARPDERSNYALGNAAEPKDMSDWRDYVRTVGTRYKGRVHEYEIWNEPNVKGFWSGSTEQMVELVREAAKVLKQVDPNIRLISPSATGPHGVEWLDQFLAAGGGAYADVIGYHFYVTPNPPEEMVAMVSDVRRVMKKYGVNDKPVWDTETGWGIQNQLSKVGPGWYGTPISIEDAAAYVARAYVLLWASGVARFYWYAWDNGNAGLTERDGKTLKAPAQAYGELEDWLLGAVMKSCASDETDTWTCEISRGDTYRAWVLWNPNTVRRFTPPATWKIVQVRELPGEVHKLVRGEQADIGPTPSLFENRSR
ncbi:MAG: hypothetical protein LAN18_03600 [Acidobacteriia bacterium]|nr:hypothetical protein [Terriglobia bacterium]